ncbi:unnamed protein product [Vitrella brassicaformis CCMP3155]|uniref:CN hydrolase domain-containing protein n=2 Tax=Vitrella brassicaformis TaxID=1169539 RepID=A0A0G4GKY6_VITBC|nr:unnamed protein product [Vitrella brassicaformis CCMP3155]|eukprot:CEM30686.1 unnamed protein product [Vitrella brassicaformis CCMP3155]
MFNTPKTIDTLERLTADARQQGACIVVFPEAFVGGYPKFADFGVRVGSRSEQGRDLYRSYHDAAITVPSAETDRIGSVARQHGIYLVVGVIEKDQGTLYCAVLTFADTGELLGTHRKVLPTAAERYIWGRGDGSTMPVFDTNCGKVGACICWENYMPLMRMAMYAKGIEIYCAPTVDDRDTWLSTCRHIAVEGRCFVLTAVQHFTRDHWPDCDLSVPAATGSLSDDGSSEPRPLIRGGSAIVSPFGEVLAGPLFNKEGVLVAEIDLNDVTRGKLDLDVSGHYARSDIFQLTVDERPKASVTFFAAD